MVPFASEDAQVMQLCIVTGKQLIEFRSKLAAAFSWTFSNFTQHLNASKKYDPRYLDKVFLGSKST